MKCIISKGGETQETALPRQLDDIMKRQVPKSIRVKQEALVDIVLLVN